MRPRRVTREKGPGLDSFLAVQKKAQGAVSQAAPGRDLWLDLPAWHRAVSVGSEELMGHSGGSFR